MDAVITLIRIPLALIASILLVSDHVAWFFIETIAAIVCLPIAVIFMSRNWIKNSWLSRYPNIIRNGFYDDEEDETIRREAIKTIKHLGLMSIPVLIIVFILSPPSKGISAGICSLFNWALSD